MCLKVDLEAFIKKEHLKRIVYLFNREAIIRFRIVGHSIKVIVRMFH